MSKSIAGYVGQLRELGARSVEFLNPGASEPGNLVRAKHPDLALPADLLDLWSVFDGCKHIEGTTLQELWLEGTFLFFSEQEAVEDYAVCLPLWESEGAFVEYWPHGFFPIATPGDGSRLLVNCNADSPTHGAVYELFHGVGVSKSSTSISNYFATASAWLAEGAIWLDDKMCVEVDSEKTFSVAAKLNPDCDSWDDDLPSAYETKDWL